MLSRRGFAGIVAAGLTEAAFAQRASVKGTTSQETVWLNANEFPEGPPAASIEAMARVVGESNRYHYQEFPAFYEALAASEGLKANQVLVGAGSSESIHDIIDAFTSPTKPLITPWPTFEAGPELAQAAGHAVVKIPLQADYSADLKKMIAAAERSGGGVIYLCNPNNPTSVMTPKKDVAWMVANLPKDTYLLVDEAYIHYSTSPDMASAMPYVRQGKNVLVTRTFSKVYAMAGMRVGYVAARPDLIDKMTPYRNNVISIVSVRGVLAALDLGPKLVEDRRAKIDKPRTELCTWLRSRKIPFIEPHGNFIMIDAGRNIKEAGPQMLDQGVAVGRPFPPYDNLMRVTIGTDAEMAKFRTALTKVMSA